MTPAVISFAAGTAELAGRIATAIGGRVHHCGFNGDSPKVLLPRLFLDGVPIVGICASGILIRLLAPHLSDKRTEPPVLAVSQDGASVVPLLGGHHGGNALARSLAEALGAHAAVTTASDLRFARGLDEPPPGWELSRDDDAKAAMMSLIVGARIALEGHAPWIAEAGYPVSSLGVVRVLVTEQKMRVERGLVYHPKTLVAGVGCERGTAAAEIIELVEFGLKRENLSAQSLAAIATIDIKADEHGIQEAARHFGVPLRLFTVTELNQERYRLKSPSAVVEAEVGTPSVAEAAALKGGPIVVQKLKSERATCAIGRSRVPIDIDRLGRPPGVLHIVGIGPGDGGSRTASAVQALDRSSDWVGYGLYLDLIKDLRIGQAEHRYELGDEEVRVRAALELAAKGKVVSLVCSGDGQIYAMASLVYELIEVRGDRALTDAARRVVVEAHPGISAFQAASAAAGALIGHDFCCISLSDLLTPRDDIVRRLDGAATADFVTALYNPRSQRRTDLIEEAKGIFLARRPVDTPVIVARNLGRKDQSVKVVALKDFDPHDVDMLTIVLFGATTSRTFTRGDGTTVAYTPRGYAGKSEAEAVPDAAAPIQMPANPIQAGVAFLRAKAAQLSGSPSQQQSPPAAASPPAAPAEEEKSAR
jgi:cobalt-precorrin 5A hydrolase/precorrin-3B C17-methyltransferase